MPLTNKHVEAMAKQCLLRRNSWLYMELNDFAVQTDEPLQWGENPEHYVERLNNQLEHNSVWDKNLHHNEYLHFVYIKATNIIMWSYHKPTGEYVFK